MSTLENRTESALLVIDVQNAVMADSFNRDSVIANINTCVDKARSAGVSVIWVQHSDEEMLVGSKEWEIVSELTPIDGEQKILKIYRSSFESTDLEGALAKLSISHLYVTGAQTNNCVRHTSHAAIDRGYDVTLISDAHTCTGYEWAGHVIDAKQVIDEQNDNFSSLTLPGRFARTSNTQELNF